MSTVRSSFIDGLPFDAGAGLWVATVTSSRGPSSERPNDGGMDISVRMLGDPGPSPLTTASDPTCHVVLQGVVTNREELRSRYGSSGAAGRSDADLVLFVYQAIGEDVLQALRGVYAVIILDRRRDTAIAARDRFGTHPLFYSLGEEGLHLASMMDALVTLPDVSGALNRPMMVDHLRHRYPDSGETYFASIRRIPHAHALTFRGGEATVDRYWDLLPSSGRVDWLHDMTTDRFAGAMEVAVARCLSLGSAGIYLSGGIDSVSVAAIATDLSTTLGVDRPLALSLGFSDPAVDERQIQRSVASQLGLRQVLVDLDDAVGPDGLLAAGLQLSASFQTPLLNYWLPGYCRLSAEARDRGVRVILSGAGGDEWLSVGPSYAADLLSRLDVAGLRRLWRVWGSSYPLSVTQMLRSLVKFGLWPIVADKSVRALRSTAPGLLVRRRRRLDIRHLPGWLAPDESLRAEAIERRARTRELVNERTELPYYLDEFRFGMEHAIVSMEAEEDFELGRRMGYLKVHPYWDPDVVDLLWRTPPDVLMRAGGKGLARAMLAERFPSLGFESQRKIVSTNLFRVTALEQGGKAWRSMGGTPLLDELGIVDAAGVQAEVDRILDGQLIDQAFRLWDFLSLEAWARGHTGDPGRTSLSDPVAGPDGSEISSS